MWNYWPASEIQHDLDVIKELGFNTYVFLFYVSLSFSFFLFSFSFFLFSFYFFLFSFPFLIFLIFSLILIFCILFSLVFPLFSLFLFLNIPLHSLRFFLTWDDFEPSPGEYNETCFEELDTFLGWVEERGLVAHCTGSLFSLLLPLRLSLSLPLPLPLLFWYIYFICSFCDIFQLQVQHL